MMNVEKTSEKMKGEQKEQITYLELFMQLGGAVVFLYSLHIKINKIVVNCGTNHKNTGDPI